MILCWPAEILLYRINNALRDASDNASKGKSFSELHWRARWRIRIWNLGEWLYYYRWKYYFKMFRHGNWEKRLKNLTPEQVKNIEKACNYLHNSRQKD